MVLIIGGAGSGQKAYAKMHYPGARILEDYHQIVRQQLEDGLDPMQEAEALAAEQTLPERQLVICTDEIGCGIVPVGAEERRWRECSGRVNCYLAARAERVIRMVCGIGTVIKG